MTNVRNFNSRAGDPLFYTVRQSDGQTDITAVWSGGPGEGVFFVLIFFFLHLLCERECGKTFARRDNVNLWVFKLLRALCYNQAPARDLCWLSVCTELRNNNKKIAHPLFAIASPMVWCSHSCNVVRKSKSKRAQKITSVDKSGG
jgi:hypothetical protein